jgi:hypothetical protein
MLPPNVKAPPPRRRPVQILRPLSVSYEEVTVHIECFPDHVVVHPSRTRISIQTLASSTNYNPLLHEVETGLARRPPGVANPRKQIRFLVHNGGERTLHIAVPVLQRLAVPKTQQTVNPGDDVSSLIAGQ